MGGNSTEYNHSYYVKHKATVISGVRDRFVSRRKAIREAKNKPCADCGKSYPYWIMQFDHVRGEKSFNIGAMSYKRGLKRVLEEIAKCDVVCANCHADRTYKRFYNRP